MNKVLQYFYPLNDELKLSPELLLTHAPTYATRSLIPGAVLFIVALLLKNHDYQFAYRAVIGLSYAFALNFGFFVGASIPKRHE